MLPSNCLFAACALLCFLNASLVGAQSQEFLLVGWSGGNGSIANGIWQYFPGSGQWNQLRLGSGIRPTAVAYDPVDDRVYWADITHRGFSSAKLDGTQYRLLKNFSGGGKVEGMYLEPNSRLLYYTHLGGGKIIVRHLDSGKEAVLLDNEIGGPRDITVDFNARTMYWTDYGSHPRVERASTDGSSREVIFDENNLDMTSGIHYDKITGILYACDVQQVGRSNYDTVFLEIDPNSKTVRQRSSLSNTYCFHLEGNATHLFISDIESRRLLVGSLSSPATAVEVRGQPSEGVPTAMSFHAQGFVRQSDPCSGGGGCRTNQLCVPARGRTTCKCVVGYRGQHCTLREEEEHFPALLSSTSNELKWVVGNPADWLRTGHSINQWVLRSQDYGKMTADMASKTIFLHNKKANTLQKYDLPAYGTSLDVKTLQRPLYDCGGMAFDGNRNELFFSASGANRTNLQTGIYKVNVLTEVASLVVSSGIISPGAMALDPFNRVLFWVDPSAGRVERSTTWGTDRRLLTNRISRPSGISINFDRNELYVTSGTSVYTLSTNGGSPRRIISDSMSMFFVAVAHHEDFIFVAAVQVFGSKIIVYKKSDYTKEIEMDRDGIINDVATAFPLPADPCARDNGGCEQVCERTGPDAFHCSCRDGYTLAPDARTCPSADACARDNGGCEQVCERTGPDAFYCSCRDDYTLKSDGRTCEADPCARDNGGCEQVCERTGTDTFHCSCRDGYTLKSDRRTCEVITTPATTSTTITTTTTRAPTTTTVHVPDIITPTVTPTITTSISKGPTPESTQGVNDVGVQEETNGDEETDSNMWSIAVVVGIAVGGVVFLAVIVAVTVVCVKKSTRTPTPPPPVPVAGFHNVRFNSNSDTASIMTQDSMHKPMPLPQAPPPAPPKQKTPSEYMQMANEDPFGPPMGDGPPGYNALRTDYLQ